MASVIYITRDIERALGRKPVGDYRIITNETPYAIEIKKEFPDNVFLIKKAEILDTYNLMLLSEVEEIIEKYKAEIIVFKNTIHIEKYCIEKEWKILNPSAELSERIENKVTGTKWLGELSSLLPPHSTSIVKDVVWNNRPSILQWSHGHTGEGTILLQNKDDFENIKNKFPYREARITDYIKGPVFTINIVINKEKILFGNISYQITGIAPFTYNPCSTIGNDWSITHTLLSDAHIEKFLSICNRVAKKMQDDDWLGLFGIDIIYDEERDELYLLEINARQTASVTFESRLQEKVHEDGVEGLTIFEAHYKALIHESNTGKLIEINDGAQIIQRWNDNIKDIDENKIIDLGYKVIKYANTKPNSDFLRIQSERGIMETHNKFNNRGKDIIDILV